MRSVRLLIGISIILITLILGSSVYAKEAGKSITVLSEKAEIAGEIL